MKIDDLTQESVTLTEMVSAPDGDPDERIEKMCNLLKKIKDFVQTENPDLGSAAGEKNLSSSCSGQTSADGSPKSIVIPDDFRCPISLELMKDPVIVSTGQVMAVNFTLTKYYVYRINHFVVTCFSIPRSIQLPLLC